MSSVRPQPLAEGRFQLLEVIGEGGMATVYRAFDQRLQRPRAIKILSPAFSQRPALRRRFLSEAQTMANLEETRVVRVFDMGEDGDRVFIVMELVEGGSLVDRVRLHGPLPARMAAQVVVDLCDSLQGAHENNVIHRDIKPHNVLLTRSGELRITDFGIAQVQHEDHAGMTRTGAVLGTWGFMAPEQKSNAKQVDARADVYSVGATLWALLKNDTPPELFMSDSEPEWYEGIPDPLAEVIRRSTRYRREERYPTARSMGDALRLVLPLLPEDPDETPPLVPRLPERPSNAEVTDTYAQLVGEGQPVPPAEGTMIPESMPGGTLARGGENDELAGGSREPDLAPIESPEQRLMRRRVPIFAGLGAMAVAAGLVWWFALGSDRMPRVPLPEGAQTGDGAGEAGSDPTGGTTDGTGAVGGGTGAGGAGTDPAGSGTEAGGATAGASGTDAEGVGVDPDGTHPEGGAQLAASGAGPAGPDGSSGPKAPSGSAGSGSPGRDPAGSTVPRPESGSSNSVGGSASTTPSDPGATVVAITPVDPGGTTAPLPRDPTPARDPSPPREPAGKLSVTAPDGVGMGSSVTVSASIGGKYTLKLYYRGAGSGAFREKAMHAAGATYSASFTVDDTMSSGVEYFVAAQDVSGKIVRDGNAMAPRRIAVGG